MDLGVGLRMGGLISVAALVLAATAGAPSIRNTHAPTIRKCADKYCRSTESTLWVQDVTFTDGKRHFDRALEAIGWDGLDACRLQNPGYWTEVLLRIRPDRSTRTWVVETTAHSIERGAPANQAVAGCFRLVFGRHLTSGLVAPDAIDAWQDTNEFVQTR